MTVEINTDKLHRFVDEFNRHEKFMYQIRHELNLSEHECVIYRKEALEHGLIPDVRYTCLSVKHYHWHKYCQKFVVTNTICGEKITFGYYNLESDAIFVRDKLIECNWDKTELPRIRSELNENKAKH